MKRKKGSSGVFGIWAMAFALAVIGAFMLLLGSANAEEKSAASDLRLEGEWLALQAGQYDAATLRADEGATECAMQLLREARRQYPEVRDVSVLPAVRTAEITMLIKVKSDEAPVVPAEIQTLRRRLAPDGATLIQFLDDNKSGRVAMIRLYFWKLLHVPSLIAECQKAKEVWDVRDASSPPPPNSDEIVLEYKSPEIRSLLKIRRLRGETKTERQWVIYTFGYTDRYPTSDPVSGLSNQSISHDFGLMDTEYETEKLEGK